MTSANALSIGCHFQVLACNSETVESFVAVVSPVCQCKQDSKIGIAICFDAKGFCGAADSVFNDLLGVGGLMGYGGVRLALTEQIQNKALERR